MKKIVTGFLFVLLGFSAFGQNVIPDSLVYFLVEHTIENVETVKIYKHVRIPSLPVKTYEDKGIGEYFTKEDTAFINYQIIDPVVKKWKKKKFTSKIHLTRTYLGAFPFFKTKQTYFISLPIFSKDLQTVQIYYESYHKFLFNTMSDGAGFVAVWKQENGKWRMILSDLVWISAWRDQNAVPITLNSAANRPYSAQYLTTKGSVCGSSCYIRQY